MILTFLVLLTPWSCFADSPVYFYQQTPSFRSAVLQIPGFVQVPAGSEPLLIDQDGEELIMLEDSGSTDGSNPRNEEIQQRFLGRFPSIFQFGRTQTIIQVVTRTSVVVPLCVLCTTTAAGNSPAVCSGLGAPIPTACPSSPNRERRGLLALLKQERIQPSKTLISATVPPFPRLPEARKEAGEFFSSTFLQSSKEDPTVGKHSFSPVIQREAFQFVTTNYSTVVVTVTATNTAQVQVGNMNCLPQYLASVSKCTSVGI